MSTGSGLRRLLGRANQRMSVSYADDLRLFPTRVRKVWLLALLLAWAFIPTLWDTWPFSIVSSRGVSLNTLAYAGVFAIAAIGLNLLTGYTGQVSLGLSVFLAAGAYGFTMASNYNTRPRAAEVARDSQVVAVRGEY